jgi:Na+/melibiose symporter-like transporter
VTHINTNVLFLVSATTTTSIMGALPPDQGQLGLWVACLISVAGSLTALMVAYRTLTKDFVTKVELESALQKLTISFNEELKENRHAFNNAINNVKMQLEAKLDAIAKVQLDNVRVLGHIEGLIQAKFGSDKSHNQQDQ